MHTQSQNTPPSVLQAKSADKLNERPNHGGDILSFCNKHDYERETCIDLSTGIAPWSWPVPEIPQEIWQSLPPSTDFENRLLKSASNYYACNKEFLLPVSGSQAGIELLPLLTKTDAQIAYPDPGYEEHRFCWENAGQITHPYQNLSELIELIGKANIDHAVVINPNNPSTEIAKQDQLEWLRNTLVKRGGFLVIDEAFVDTAPDISQMRQAGKEGLIILRSTGKFFGLAGLRLGFIAASPKAIEKLRSLAGLWPVHTAALWMGEKMLSDEAWVEIQRERINMTSDELISLVKSKFPNLDWSQSELFVSGVGADSLVSGYIAQLAKARIHSRRFPLGDNEALLRLGLPSDKALELIGDL